MKIFSYKLTGDYLSTGDVASLRNALVCGLCRLGVISRVCCRIPASYRVRAVVGVRVSFWLHVAS